METQKNLHLNKPEENFALRIYFDGLCPLCSREIDHYKRQKGSERLQFIDITGPQFDAAAEGLDPFKVHKVMHVKNDTGQVITGVDAFIAIWEVLPNFNFMAKLGRMALVRPLLELGYHGFVIVRPFLPRRKRADINDCAASPYCETVKEKA